MISGLPQERPSRRGGLQFEVPRVKHKLGKESVQYRGPVIRNFINRLVNFNANIQKHSFNKIYIGSHKTEIASRPKRP